MGGFLDVGWRLFLWCFFGWMNGALCRMWMGALSGGRFVFFFRCVRELKSEKEKNLFRRDCSDVYSVVIKCES